MGQSLSRKLKRGNLKIEKSKFVTNEDGSAKIVFRKKTKRGRWI